MTNTTLILHLYPNHSHQRVYAAKHHSPLAMDLCLIELCSRLKGDRTQLIVANTTQAHRQLLASACLAVDGDWQADARGMLQKDTIVHLTAMHNPAWTSIHCQMAGSWQARLQMGEMAWKTLLTPAMQPLEPGIHYALLDYRQDMHQAALQRLDISGLGSQPGTPWATHQDHQGYSRPVQSLLKKKFDHTIEQQATDVAIARYRFIS